MKTVADYLIERLSQWGVHRLYGYTGDSINPVMGALRKAETSHEADGAMRFVQVRHEEMAAFMACAHAKFTGQLGVCCASAGPGSIHLLNGLYDAKMDNQPVVALLGQLPRSAMGSDYQQEVDLANLFKDVAGDYVQVLNSPEQARQLLDQAVRTALSERTVTCLILPHDVQRMKAVEHPPHKHHHTQSGIGYKVPMVIPRENDLKHAADVLNDGERVAILVGAGALNATDEIIAVAETLGAGVAKSLLGLAALPYDVAFVTGSVGLLGTVPSWELMSECDTLLMLGSDFPYTEFLPKEGQARGVQIDIRGRHLSKRYPMEVNLVGDVKETLLALLPLLETKTNRQWQNKIIASVNHWQNVIYERAMLDTSVDTDLDDDTDHAQNGDTPNGGVNPQRVYEALFRHLPERSIVTCDTGTSTVWYAQYHRFRRGMMGSVSGKLASMGAGVPYAIAAKFAYPDRPVIALAGDGAMQMNGLNELLTIQRDWHEWENPSFIVLVLNNRELNFVTWEMRVMEGDPKYETSQDIPDFQYAAFARSLGFKGLCINTADDVERVWQEAFTSDRPVLIEACTSANVPPLPPHISIEQAYHFSKAMMGGDPEAMDVIKNSFKQMAKILTPH